MRKPIAIIATVAAVLLMGAMLALPAMADPGKVDICHWANAKGFQGWGIVNISHHAVAMHIANHNDKGSEPGGLQFDSLLDASDCEARNG